MATRPTSAVSDTDGTFDAALTTRTQLALEGAPYPIRKLLDIPNIKVYKAPVPAGSASLSGGVSPIAGVREGDTNKILVYDPARYSTDPGGRGSKQLPIHEATHLVQNLMDKMDTAKFPENDEADPYKDMKLTADDLMNLRQNGDTLWDHSREGQASIIQKYVARHEWLDNEATPQERKDYLSNSGEFQDNGNAKFEAAYAPYLNDIDQIKRPQGSFDASVNTTPSSSSALIYAVHVLNGHPKMDGVVPSADPLEDWQTVQPPSTDDWKNVSRGTSPVNTAQLPPDTAQQAWEAGIHGKMLNMEPGTAYKQSDEIDKQLRTISPNYDDGKLDDTFSNDIKAGWENSIVGLTQSQKLPQEIRNPGVVDKFISSISQMVGDAPAMMAGGLAGGAAGSEVPVVGNVVGAAAGAFALPAAGREALMQGIKNGNVTSFSDMLRRTSKIAWAGTKGAITGAATEAAGGLPVGSFIAKSGLASFAVKGLYQATALTTAADLLEGKIPNKNDFAGNAAFIVPLNLITHGMTMGKGETNQALMDVYAKDGKTPEASTDSLHAQPPVKPDQPEGLRPAIQTPEAIVDGDTTENHTELATRTMGKKPVSMEELEAEPEKADKILENPVIHEQSVIDRAYEIKKDAVDRGEVYDKSEDREGLKTEELPPAIRSIAEEYGKDRSAPGSGETEESNPYNDARWTKQTLDVEQAWSRAQLRMGMSSIVRGTSRTEGPIVVDDRGIVLDGNHRLFEARNRGDESIEAYVLSPKPKVLNIDDLYNHASMKSGRGFVTPDGKFLSRMEAKQWMKTNEPDVHEMWTSVAGDKSAEFHSEDYSKARYRVQARSVAEGDPTIANVSPENAARLAAAREDLNKIKAGDASKGYGREVLRTLFVGQRDTRIAATTQLRDSLKKIIPDFHDQEALSILRDYKGTEGQLTAERDRIVASGTEREKELLPSIERAINPTPKLLEADKRLTDYYSSALQEGRELGFMDSSIDPSHYSPHLLTRILDGEKPSGAGRGSLATTTPFAKERSYPTVLDAMKTGHLDARTINALDSLSIYGDRHATVVATKLLATELKNTELGKYGTRDEHPEGWTELAPGQHVLRQGSDSLYVPKDVADALRPIIEQDVLSHQPGMKAFKAVQGYTKSIELGLSIFHQKALTITAMNNMSFSDFARSLASDNQSPEFQQAEREAAADGLVTSKTGTPYEAYQGLSKSSIKQSFDIRQLPGLKQLDSIAHALTHETFDVIQRKFKVQDFSLKAASWMAKHPEATDEERFAARRSIAKEVNSAYGGLNWEVMGWGKNAKELVRMVMLAPDWTFSNVANLKYAGEGGPAGSAARMFWVKSFSTGIALTQATSIAISGQTSDHPTQVYLGKDKNGKPIYSNWFFAGAPKDAITLLGRVQKDGALTGLAEFLTGKLGPIAGTVMGLSTNKQYSGKPIAKAKDNFAEKTAKQAEFVAGKAVPFTIENIAQMLLDGKDHSMMEYIGALAGMSSTHEAAKSGPAKEQVLPGAKKRSKSVTGAKKFSIRGRR